jgi:acetyl esterase/lipase
MLRKGYGRSHASEYHLDPRRIGVWEFSAGGHLAAQTATHFEAGNPAAQDTIERASSRTDFAILSYPVIGPLGCSEKAARPTARRHDSNLVATVTRTAQICKLELPGSR